MQVKDWMSRFPISVPPSTPMLDARKLMQEQQIRHLLVMEGPELVGIVTDRDIRLNLPSPATSLSVWELNHLLGKLTVGEVMTKAVITVGVNRAIEAAARLMLDHRIGGLPVLDGGRVVGILTETDILCAFVHVTEATAAADPTPARA